MKQPAKSLLPAPTESQEQQNVFQWAKLWQGKYPELSLLYHIPNEGKRHPATGARMRAEGLKAGVPDICLPVPRGNFHGLYIEMKRLRGSTTTEKQKEWLEMLKEQGYKTEVCKGAKAAIEVLLAYLHAGNDR